MNPALRRTGVIALALLGALIVQATWVGFFHHDEYQGVLSGRTLIAEYSVPRGSIYAGDLVIAQSVPTDGGTYGYKRDYPEGDYFSNLTGFKSMTYGATGLEYAENDLLNGTSSLLAFDDFWATVLKERKPGGHVVTTIDPELQKAAFEALANSGVNGAAVVLDPRTGRVLAQVSYPGWNPTEKSSNNYEVASAANAALEDDPDNPERDRSRLEHYPPGSTFKTIVAAAFIEAGGSADSIVPAGNSYNAPNTTHTITNSADQCPQEQMTLREAFAKSCNTTFAKLCVEELSAEQIEETAEAFGFGEAYETPLATEPSSTGDLSEPAFRAQACIGQQDVQETVLQNALIAATIANDGERMAPQLIAELTDSEGGKVRSGPEDSLGRSIDRDTARELQDLMEAVVDPGGNGTGKNAAVSGYTVGGKTGTAEHSDSSDNVEPDHGWFHGWAMGDDGEPAVAVCVFLDSYGDGASAKAADISGDLMERVLNGD